MSKRFIVKLECPECGHKWECAYWSWIFKTLFHEYVFHQRKDYRKTLCPKCGKKSWITRQK